MKQNLIGIFKFFDGALLLIICLHHQMSAIDLFHLSVDMSQIFLLLAEIFLRMFDNKRNQDADTGRITSEINVIIPEIEIIITSVPTSVATLVMICVTL